MKKARVRRSRFGSVWMFAGAFAACLGGAALWARGSAEETVIRPVPFTQVRFLDRFWTPRLETNRKVTIPYCFRKCEETGRIANFARAGGLEKGPFQGIRFNDSDVFKVIEGAAYSLRLHPDPKLEAYLDDLIRKIAAAQEDDGYLYTARTIDPEHPAPGSGKERWSFLAHSHELYNVGHLYEAAVAHYLATGKRTLLDVALRNADLVARVFGPEGRRDVPGHQEIEIGLVKLYRVTGEEKYLRLAKFFLDERGRPHGRKLYGTYAQDHLPVAQQREAVGHAVRAGYMYSAMADVAALTGETSYLEALRAIWRDVVGRKLYITGGIGSRGGGEAFGAPYELPNASAYNETCAAIANALWNHRMFLLEGDARYLDVLERVLYNGFLAGVSLKGDRFFYPNPLACDGRRPFNHGSPERQPWFDCSCCPVNVVRFLPSIPGYVYAVRGREIFANLFVASEAELEVVKTKVRIRQKTAYPWSGKVRFEVDPEKECRFALRIRIPGWAAGRPVPSDLYRYLEGEPGKIGIRVGGEPLDPPRDRGFVVIDRTWRPGDRVEIDLPMAVRRVVAHEKVEADRGRTALERGPIVYCLEGVDHGGRVSHLVLPDEARLEPEERPDLLGGVTVLRGRGLAVRRRADGSVGTEPAAITAIPYYAWCHRGATEMTVWIPRSPEVARPLPEETLATRSRVRASHCWRADTPEAVNDRILPQKSSDHEIPRFTWWDRRGTREWIEYEFPAETEVRRVRVYWFDDTGVGSCRPPQSWRLLANAGGAWREVEADGPYGVETDRFNEVRFKPVRARALRIEVELRPGFSAGILEWEVE